MNKLKRIPNLYFEQCRQRKYWTLEKASQNLGLDTTYLNKIENGKIAIQNYVMHIFMNRYKIDPVKCDYCHFDAVILSDMMKEIASGNFDDSILLELIEEHEGSFYQSYLLIMLFAYKAAKVEYDSHFEELYESLNKIIHLYDQEYQYFFYLYAANYMIRKYDANKYLEYKKKIDDLNRNEYLPVKTYNQILYIVYIRKYDELFDLIHICQMQLENEPNNKIKNSMLFIQAAFYQSISQYDYANKLYKDYAKLCKANGDYVNYGIGESNIAWLYNLQKDYKQAIEHYLIAIKYVDDSDLYFDIAWCYFAVDEKEEAMHFILEGKKKTTDTMWITYLEWLERMIKTPYGKRCKQKLIKLYTNYYDLQPLEMKNFLLIALINQYKKNKDEENMNIYVKQLIELNGQYNISIE